MATPQTSARPARDAELELTIDTLAHGGNGVARLDGYVVFVAGGMPGDRVRAVVGKAKRAYAEARAIEILEPSPDRIEPLADHPGAPWQVLSYERQLEVKAEQVGDALRRIGRLEGFEQEPIVPAVARWRYRNKLEYSFGTAPDGTLVCGFHASGRFDEIVPLDDCLLASERGNAVREQVLAWCREQGLSSWDRRDQRGLLRNLVVREGRRTGELQVRLVTSPGAIDGDGLAAAVDCDGLFWTRTAGLGESTQGGETTRLAGSKRLREQLGELELLISPDAFFQTNTEMAELLYGAAVELTGLRGHERVFDLYCGIGTIGLWLASRAREVIGVEIVAPAVADAIDNARRNEITNASFFAGDIRLAMRDLVEQAGRPDVCVLDPPRAGLSQKIVRRIVEAAPKRILYVSCNPTTLAPNAAQLVEAGYALRRVRPVDMFPQTPHIECVALLERA
ncbi:MAG TPA: 23S rRNA (uracil(1939)-C(5))-methyltransferase RlmD [Solirubrobacteraceae bacterium]|nr:23S rRNA (uracil(1939)-C(5))-methyltransferase RlmD [Solirubrobacteraceae bacterium]